MKCKYEHDGDCCNAGADQYRRKCKKPCEFLWALSNGDRFRAMSDEELADYLSDRTCPPRETNCVGENCMDCWLQYLRQPAEVPT